MTKRFLRMYKKLSRTDQQRADDALILFEKDPFNSTLRNHKPQGKLKGTRSISAGYDLRILYREEGGHAIVFLLMVGSHDAVY